MGDWLGTGNVSNRDKNFRPFGEARQFVHKLKLKNVKQWLTYCQGKVPGKGMKPADIPANPERAYYYKGWVSYGDWLGTGNVHASRIRYESYKAARNFVRSIGIKTCIEWKEYVKGNMQHLPPKPSTIPSNIERHFKDKWVSWKNFLGTGK